MPDAALNPRRILSSLVTPHFPVAEPIQCRAHQSSSYCWICTKKLDPIFIIMEELNLVGVLVLQPFL